MKKLKRFLLPLVYQLLVLWWFFSRPNTSGVKCVVRNKNLVLLIKQTYSHKKWTFPGGGIDKSETPEGAVMREVAEEVGVAISDPISIGVYEKFEDYKHDTVHCFEAWPTDPHVVCDGVEIGEVAWFPIKALPEQRAASVDRILAFTNT